MIIEDYQSPLTDKLDSWILENRLDTQWMYDETVPALYIDEVGYFVLIENKEEKLFDDEFDLLLFQDEVDSAEGYHARTGHEVFYLFEFGGKFYFTPINKTEKPFLHLFKYLGHAQQGLSVETYLGVHGQYELLNGSRSYSDWCAKALFLGIESLGLCEHNTLAGTLPFQLACKENGIQSILGESINIQLNDQIVTVRCFVINDEGWQNLLQLNRYINVINEGFVEYKDFLKHLEGLVVVLSTEFPFDLTFIRNLKKHCKDLYYQIDTVIWDGDEKDEQHLKAIAKYLKHQSFANAYIKPVLLNDSYYLDKQDGHIKKSLNTIRGKFENDSKDQYFKTAEDSFNTLSSLFKEGDEQLYIFFDQIIKSAQEIADKCQFTIPIKQLLLPKYEAKDGKKIDNEKLFFDLIDKGADKKINPKDQAEADEYGQRIEHEVSVIKEGGFIDYFLILWDVVEWCKEQNILLGVGRGSAGGSLISYLLGITKIDPLKYGLLFNRFLNSGRLKEGLPDIDIDVEGFRRDEVKRYVEERYGQEYVCCVGSYTTLQLKAAIQDLGRLKGIDPKTRSYMTAILDTESGNWQDIFINAAQKPVLRTFVKNNVALINDIQLCLGSPKSASMHASATVIVPKQKGKEKYNIFNWLPVRKTEDGVLISEWEGEYLEKAGFLKADFLAIQQLDKFRSIFDLVKENEEIELSLDEVPLDNRQMYSLFKEGLNEDVFHFGSSGLKAYSQEIQPDNIEDLIAMLALFRPGAMDSGSHIEYVLLKHGKRQPTYDFGLKEVTKDTFGLLVYQEQVIKAVQVLGGLTETEGDSVRRAIGKKIQSEMDQWKERFIEGAVHNGCPEKQAIEIWNKIEVFANYSFNKSHATAYAITGAICQWLKIKYPIAFWTTAFHFAKDNSDTSRYISEIKKINDKIKIIPPDINHSQAGFSADYDKQIIYWSLEKVTQVGDVAGSTVIAERERNGEFFSLEEFYKRVPKAKVKSNVLLNLILAGCFDQLHDINKPQDRMELIYEYEKLIKKKEDLQIDEMSLSEIKNKPIYWWTLKQKELSGLGHIDYKQLIKGSAMKGLVDLYIDPLTFFTDSIVEKFQSRSSVGVIAGVVQQVIERDSKKGKFGQVLLECNDELIYVTFWSEIWGSFAQEIKGSVKCICIVSGKVVDDKYKKTNVLQTVERTKAIIL